NKSLLVSRDVQFRENIFPFKCQPQTSSPLFPVNNQDLSEDLGNPISTPVLSDLSANDQHTYEEPQNTMTVTDTIALQPPQLVISPIAE
ncbi:hypothetical protein HAX54_021012, partial [Datura stramonium]|nr:hypothetical protein [Datura stramonium]